MSLVKSIALALTLGAHIEVLCLPEFATQLHALLVETRLDRLLLNTYPWLDRTTVEDLIAAGHIRLNGRLAQ